MRNRKWCVLLLMICGCFTNVLAQPGERSLQQKIAGKRNLQEIMQIVRAHYAAEEAAEKKLNNKEEEDEGEKEIYFWERWAKANEHRVDGNGNLYNNPDSIINAEWKKYGDLHTAELSNPAALSNTSAWAPFGPSSITQTASSNSAGIGRVSCIAFHPTDPNTLIIGTPQGGIWKTVNAGSSWFSISDGLSNMGIGGICIDKTNPNNIIALTGDGDGAYGIGSNVQQSSTGIYRSTDGGSNWTRVYVFAFGGPVQPTGVNGYKLLQHPYFPNNIYAAVSDGIYASSDYGVTWTLKQAGNFTDIEVKPDAIGSVMYATRLAYSSYFWRSTDFGNTWNSVSISGINGLVRSAIAVSPNNPSAVYLLTGSDYTPVTPPTPAPPRYYKGVYKSTNDDTSFTMVCNTPNILNLDPNGAGNGDQSIYDICIAADPANQQNVIAGGNNIWSSTNGNSNPMTFSRRSWWQINSPNEQFVHADIHDLSYNPLNNYLYALTDGGVSVSTNNGTNWTTISNNLHILASVFGDWYEPDVNVLATGTQDNGTVLKNLNTNTYTNIGGGDGGDVLINQSNQQDIVYGITGSLVRTINTGNNQTNATPASFFWNNFYPILARNYSDDNNIFTAGSGGVYHSSNRGTSWDSTVAVFNASNVLTTCRSNTLRIYAGFSGGNVYRSDNGGISFTQIANGNGLSGRPVTDIEATHSTSSTIYACIGGYTPGAKVYMSTDAGLNWTNVSGSLPNLACLSIILDVNNNVYVGMDAGVYVKPAGQNDWRPFFNGLPKTPVSDLIVNQSAGKIIAVTFGHGNFISDLYANSCPATLPLTGTIVGNNFFEATSITATATISGGEGTRVAVSGANEIRMQDGFSVVSGSTYRAYNAPCGALGVPLRLSGLKDTISMDKIVFKASREKPFPYGHLNETAMGIFNIAYEKAGDYLIRIAYPDGSVVGEPIQKNITNAGREMMDLSIYHLPKGNYYVQLFYEKNLVHFLEYNIDR